MGKLLTVHGRSSSVLVSESEKQEHERKEFNITPTYEGFLLVSADMPTNVHQEIMKNYKVDRLYFPIHDPRQKQRYVKSQLMKWILF